MATLEQLEQRGVLQRLAMPKVAPQFREIWALERVIAWIKDDLPKAEAMYPDEVGRPLAQAFGLLASFIRGEEMHVGEDFWRMRPPEADVFELKSLDVRFFGWFVAPRRFLIAAACTFEEAHTYGLHPGYRDEVIRLRAALDLDEPKVVSGAEPRDVL